MTGGIVRVGIAGWTYAPWRGTFYPSALKREQELGYAASHVRTIEINDTFYAMPRPEVFETWALQAPADFAFTVVAPRNITHVRRLNDAQIPVANFLASGPLRLGIHLGPILWRLPFNLRFDPKQIEPFLRLLPHDTTAAAAMGRKHANAPRGFAVPDADPRRPVRHAIEIRHESFRCKEFIELLRAHDVALVCADSEKWPMLMDVTSDFVYCRLLGSQPRQANGYDHAALDEWVRRITAWAQGNEPEDGERVAGKARPRRRDVFVFFNNDKKVRAPANAMELIRRLRA